MRGVGLGFVDGVVMVYVDNVVSTWGDMSLLLRHVELRLSQMGSCVVGRCVLQLVWSWRNRMLVVLMMLSYRLRVSSDGGAGGYLS